jgi:hypothetical protein
VYRTEKAAAVFGRLTDLLPHPPLRPRAPAVEGREPIISGKVLVTRTTT